MEHHSTEVHHHARLSHTTPKDFFLWLGTVVALYGSVISFLTLMFHYVDLAFPDPLEYSFDPYSTGTRVAMASLIVLVPTALALLMVNRKEIVREPGKADIWVRKWSLVLTIFLAGSIAAIDLITLLYSFFGGDLTTRFTLKAVLVLLLALFTTMHFLADYWGYWSLHRRKANLIGAAVGAVAIMTVVGGFMLIGSPSHLRAARFDAERSSDLQEIQSQVITYWQQKGALPITLEALNDSLTGYTVPTDPSTHMPYTYKAIDAHSFSLCATFTQPSSDTGMPRGGMYQPDMNVVHGVGNTCFTRTIDPERTPAAPKTYQD